MELPHIGQNCEFEECKILDFLPFKCNYCKKILCKNHITAESHSCSSVPATYKDEISIISHPCSLVVCKSSVPTPIICSECKKNFCLSHRHPTDHQCDAFVPPINPMAEADAKIHQLAQQLPSAVPKKPSKKNEKLAAKIQLMKLKDQAKGCIALPVEERVFFSILSKSFAGSCPIFVSKKWCFGRVLDAVAEHAKIPNNNNKSNSARLELFREGEETPIRPLDALLEDLLDKEQLYNGQSLHLNFTDGLQ